MALVPTQALRATTSGKVRATRYDLRGWLSLTRLYHLHDNYRWKDIIRRYALDRNGFQRLEGGLAIRAVPQMTDVCAVTVFGFFGGDQFVFAFNAVHSKSGAAICCHPRHAKISRYRPAKTIQQTHNGANLFYSALNQFNGHARSKSNPTAGAHSRRAAFHRQEHTGNLRDSACGLRTPGKNHARSCALRRKPVFKRGSDDAGRPKVSERNLACEIVKKSV